MFKNSLLNEHLKLVNSLQYGKKLELLNKMSFLELSCIVIAVRKEIIEKVKLAIPNNLTRNIWFIIGGTGVGKTTTSLFLRGDEMVAKSFHYDSKSDTNKLIEHSLSESGSLQPNIHSVNNLVLVDFPGFNHTSGRWVCLGLELALRALIEEFQPQILVLNNVNSANHYDGLNYTEELSLKLNRLLANKEVCTLGLTRYTESPYYEKIHSIEHQQSIDLLDTKEKELLDLIGLSRLLRFDDLQNPATLSTCLQALSVSPRKSARANPMRKLDPNDERLITTLFKNSLLPQLNSGEECQTKRYETYESLKKAIGEHTLIYAISKPEIAEFLHCSNFDPILVKQFNETVLEQCVQIQLNYLMNLYTCLRENHSKLEMQKDVPHMTSFIKQIKALKNHLKTVLNCQGKENLDKWISAKHEYRSSDSLIESSRLPAWVGLLSYIQLNKTDELIKCIESLKSNKKCSLTAEVVYRSINEIINSLACHDELIRLKYLNEQPRPLNQDLEETTNATITLRM